MFNEHEAFERQVKKKNWAQRELLTTKPIAWPIGVVVP
jgi:hypothetical protein